MWLRPLSSTNHRLELELTAGATTLPLCPHEAPPAGQSASLWGCDKSRGDQANIPLLFLWGLSAPMTLFLDYE